MVALDVPREAAAEEVLCSGEVDGERRGLQGAGGGPDRGGRRLELMAMGIGLLSACMGGGAGGGVGGTMGREGIGQRVRFRSGWA